MIGQRLLCVVYYPSVLYVCMSGIDAGGEGDVAAKGFREKLSLGRSLYVRVPLHAHSRPTPQ